MDFDRELDDLRVKVADVQASVRAAANETHDQIQERIDEAQGKLNKEAIAAQAQADQVGDQAQDQWKKVKADAAARIAKAKRGIDHRGDQFDADMADSDAAWAESRRRGRDRLRRLCGRECARGDPRRDRRPHVCPAEGRSRPTGLTQPFGPASAGIRRPANRRQVICRWRRRRLAPDAWVTCLVRAG